MLRILFVVLLSLVAIPALAQTPYPFVVSSCGTQSFTAGQAKPLTMDTTGNLCTGAVFTGSITVGTVGQGAKGTDASADSWYVQPGTGAVFQVSPTTAANTAGNPFYVNPGTGANFAGAAPMQSTGGTVGLVAGSAIVGKVGIDQTTPGTTNAVQATNFPTGLTATGNALDVNLKSGLTSLSVTQGTSPWIIAGGGTAGSAASGVVTIQGIASMTKLLVTPDAGSTVQPIGGTTGGTSSFHVIAAANDNHTVIKNGAGTTYSIDCTTSGTAFAYVRLYDAGTGFNGCNSATNLVWGAICPAAATASGTGAGFMKDFTVGRAFSTGISICITGALGDTDTTNAPTTAVVNVGYK